MNTWDFKSDDHRSENTIANYIIFCEDENDEPYYFNSFQIEHKLKINTIPNQGKKKLNIDKAIKKCVDDGLMNCRENSYKIKEGITENIWCVFDRDLENEDVNKVRDEDDISFTTSIQTAKSAGIKVAWSNDAFELWVLLHFENIPTGSRLNRSYIYDRLTKIFKTHTTRTPELDKITRHAHFNYKTNMKRRLTFLLCVLPILKLNTEQAIKRAGLLESNYADNIPFHNCNPCTKVHHLVAELVSYHV